MAHRSPSGPRARLAVVVVVLVLLALIIEAVLIGWDVLT
jgi:hypothetical protein